MTTPGKTALIVGATGVVGQACLRHFASLPGWRAIGVARRPITPPPGAEALQLDLQDSAACAAALASRDDITHVVYAAVYEQPGGLVGGWRDQDQMRTNLQMLRNVVEPLDRPGGALRHVTIMQGGKAYGVHIHPEIAVPARERWPRDAHENFYWLQEDFLRERQAKASTSTGWHFTIMRPRIVFGDAMGSHMNPIPAIGVYAWLRHEQGLPLSYPGGPARVNQAIDADLIAQACAWAAEAPNARNETFNLENGDVFVWQNVWPAIADALGMPVGEPEPQSLGATVPGQQKAWERIVDKYQLAAPRELAAFIGQGATYADFQMNHGKTGPLPPVIMSSVKIRQAGFAACMDTEDMFRKWFGQLQQRRLLPTPAEARA
ncbi:NAD-dependent epimerase [Acidovorax carolinensis]|uniref:NAD-dependent epimerase n=1 Tax=Acidovorax carolinensis TaxID=553814 RepID=A0A240U6F1_9BURK|nr:SDR family oxidoreductase [Acidovorax carolinensis]ART53024.1 NAD-dependent epimerase [Acidovorax carolinensis]